jgi:TadE-like protein
MSVSRDDRKEAAVRTSAKKVRRQRERLKSERGQAILETALTLPLILLVSISILEFGRCYQTIQIMTNAAREGARVAIVPLTTDEDIETRVTDYLESGNLAVGDDVGIGVDIDREIDIAAGGASATGSRITVTYPFSFMVLNPIANLVVKGSLLGSPIELSATAQMRNEG